MAWRCGAREQASSELAAAIGSAGPGSAGKGREGRRAPAPSAARSLEVKRGSKYEGIILDPPKYGRGPTGEVWRLFEDLPEMIHLCAQLLSDEAAFLLLNAYAARVSGPALAHLLAEAIGPQRGGIIDHGELTLIEDARPPKGQKPSLLPPREIGLSFFARWRDA